MWKNRLSSILTMGLSIFAILLINAAPSQGDRGDIIDGDDLTVGDVAVEGTLTDDGQCEFDVFEISTSANGDGMTKWLSLTLNDGCQFIVDAKWVGELEMGPSKVIDALLSLLKYQTEEIEESPFAADEVADKTITMALLACKTSYQYVYMYGYGGSGDKLTKKWGTLTFCYNGVSATISSQSGTCQGSSPSYWSWLVDGCVTTNVIPGPANAVSRSGRGNYHCNPAGTAPCNISNPDGFYHELRESETGYGNGTSICTYGYGGVIVQGVGRQILQGCN